MKLSYETCPDLQGLVHSVAYLIRGAVFRPRYENFETSRPGRSSLGIRPLGELMDMYHTRKATERHDKVYALLGMSSDNPSAAGLSPNYEASWEEVFRKLVKFSASDQIYVDTWDDKEVAVLKGKGCVLGKVSSVRRGVPRDDRQSVGITWKDHFDTEGDQGSDFIFPASAKPIQEGDAVCFLQGASKPTIVRPCNGYSAIIMIAVPLTGDLQPASAKWSKLLQSVTAFPNDVLLVWDCDASQGKSQDGGDYERLISSREGPKCSRRECKCQNYVDEATRLWDFGLLLNGMERYEEAGENLRKAVEVYGTALRSADNSHGPWREADEKALKVMDDLLVEEKGAAIEAKYKECGQTPLAWAAQTGHDAVVRLLLDKGADTEVRDKYGQTPLRLAIERGHEAVVRLLLDKGANTERRDAGGLTPLWWAAETRDEAVMRLLLDKGADTEVRNIVGKTPLLYAAGKGHEAVVRLLLEKGAAIEGKDDQRRTPLLWAAETGQEAVVRLLLGKGAAIETKDSFLKTPLQRAAETGNGGIVQLLLEKGAAIDTKNSFRKTPLQWAAKRGHKNLVKLLQRSP